MPIPFRGANWLGLERKTFGLSDCRTQPAAPGVMTAPVAPPGDPEHRKGAAGVADGPSVVVGQRDAPDLDGAAHPHRGGFGSEMALTHRAEMTGVELDPDDAAPGSGGQGGTEAGRRLGQKCGDATVEDPVGLVHPPVDREAHHDTLGAGLEGLDVEQVVDAGVQVR